MTHEVQHHPDRRAIFAKTSVAATIYLATMASIHKEIVVERPAEHVWAATRDIGNIHTRLAREFVLDTRLEGDSRVVTFANGTVVRERIVDIDDASRRLAYSLVEWQTTHHHASFQVFAEGEMRSRIVWIADLLPDTLAAPVGSMMEQGSAAIKRTLESTIEVPNPARGACPVS